MAKVLIVDDEINICQVLSTLLSTQGYEVTALQNAEEAMERIISEDFDLLLSDIRMHPVNGIQLLEHAHKVKPSMAVVMLTAYSSLETAANSLKLGAFDYLPKPFKVPELIETIKSAIEYSHALKHQKEVAEHKPPRFHIDNVIAESSAMQAVCELVKRIGPTTSPVLLYGEDGTGKALIAKAIHDHSKRSKKYFVTLNCAETPEPVLRAELLGYIKGAFDGADKHSAGVLEKAEGGTVFLEEIDAMPKSIQKDLAGVMSSRKVKRMGGTEDIAIDTRFLAATNSNPSKLVNEGKLDPDLNARIGVMPIEIKPLRERREDIVPIAKYLTRNIGEASDSSVKLHPDILPILQSYSWPGNIKELQNTLTEAIQKTEDNIIAKESLPERIANTPIQKDIVSELKELESTRGKALKRFLKTQESDYLKRIRPEK